jgi:hypothetical protein
MTIICIINIDSNFKQLKISFSFKKKMTKLNENILFLIFEELKDDNNTLYSCLSTNRTLCKIAVPILWKNPWKFLKYTGWKQILYIIILHLSNESKNACIELSTFWKIHIKNLCLIILVFVDIWTLLINSWTIYTILIKNLKVF